MTIFFPVLFKSCLFVVSHLNVMDCEGTELNLEHTLVTFQYVSLMYSIGHEQSVEGGN